MEVGSFRSSFLISLGLHAGLMFACVLLWTKRAAHQPERPATFVEIVRIPDKSRQQIVQSPSSKESDKPKKDSFLGEKNQVVDRETVSRGNPTVGSQAAPNQPLSKESSKSSSKQALSAPLLEKSIPSVKSLGIPIMPLLRDFADGKGLEREQGPEWASPGFRAQDWIKGLKESDRTALNTREYVYFGYYQRIRKRLDLAWIPILREKLIRIYRSGRRLANDIEYSTQVLVVMNNKGEIVRVQVINESGRIDLDEAAVRAFNRAGPFPNPPNGIVDANGEIQIPWEFVLHT